MAEINCEAYQRKATDNVCADAEMTHVEAVCCVHEYRCVADVLVT